MVAEWYDAEFKNLNQGIKNVPIRIEGDYVENL